MDFDQVLSMFTPPTRIGVQRSTIGFGEALAGRGSDINNAIGAFVPLLNDLGPVARNLASPRTDLAGFFQGLEQYAGALAPVAQTRRSCSPTSTPPSGRWRASLCRRCRTRSRTRRRTSRRRSTAAPIIRPFLTDTASLFHDCVRARRRCRTALRCWPTRSPIGTRNLPGTAALDARTVTLSKAVGELRHQPVGARGAWTASR